jgi:hypothetical protein
MVKRWSVTVTDGQPFKILKDLKMELGVSAAIRVCRCMCIGSPMLTGFIKPCILLPDTDWNDVELRLIIKHELVHLKRKDLEYKFLVLLATAVHWFNPIVHLIGKAIDISCELSCDFETVRNTSKGVCLRYSETILGVVKYQSKLKTALSTNFFGGRNGMRKRIFSIMDTSKKKAGLTIVCIALIATLGIGFAFAANTDGTASQAKRSDYTTGTTERATSTYAADETESPATTRIVGDGEEYEPATTTYAAAAGKTPTTTRIVGEGEEYESATPTHSIAESTAEEVIAYVNNARSPAQKSNREMSKSERLRLAILEGRYESGEIMPAAEFSLTLGSDRVYLDTATGTIYYPEDGDMTDEELLQIIDWRAKVNEILATQIPVDDSPVDSVISESQALDIGLEAIEEEFGVDTKDMKVGVGMGPKFNQTEWLVRADPKNVRVLIALDVPHARYAAFVDTTTGDIISCQALNWPPDKSE